MHRLLIAALLALTLAPAAARGQAAPLPCPADVNRDGRVDCGDLLAFFGEWERWCCGGLFECECTNADVNRDCSITVADYLALLDHFESGC